MGKSIEDNCNEGEHEFVKSIGGDERHIGGHQGSCYHCRSTVSITDDYILVSGKVYELKRVVYNAE